MLKEENILRNATIILYIIYFWRAIEKHGLVYMHDIFDKEIVHNPFATRPRQEPWSFISLPAIIIFCHKYIADSSSDEIWVIKADIKSFA